ncbi:hypothetical protein SK128_007426 [Halocaridina rubra]|uniref:Uncharacterized protein n=1 Tax=Halocaridina rubra TaxID=373956 RepID=A0AAN9AF11_HALRR
MEVNASKQIGTVHIHCWNFVVGENTCQADLSAGTLGWLFVSVTCDCSYLVAEWICLPVIGQCDPSLTPYYRRNSCDRASKNISVFIRTAVSVMAFRKQPHRSLKYYREEITLSFFLSF